MTDIFKIQRKIKIEQDTPGAVCSVIRCDTQILKGDVDMKDPCIHVGGLKGYGKVT